MQQSNTVQEAIRKLEYYCAYQERCHNEVIAKLKALNMIPEAVDHIVVHLIQNNFLNEERYAISFATGKHNIKAWGRVRIKNELKFRNISTYNINKALSEISGQDYFDKFNTTAENYWAGAKEKDRLRKCKKCADYLLRKGYESDLVYSKIQELRNADT